MLIKIREIITCYENRSPIIKIIIIKIHIGVRKKALINMYIRGTGIAHTKKITLSTRVAGYAVTRALVFMDFISTSSSLLSFLSTILVQTSHPIHLNSSTHITSIHTLI